MWLVLGSDASLAASKTVYLSPWTTTSSSVLLTLCMRSFTVWVPCYTTSLLLGVLPWGRDRRYRNHRALTLRQQHCCSAQYNRMKI